MLKMKQTNKETKSAQPSPISKCLHGKQTLEARRKIQLTANFMDILGQFVLNADPLACFVRIFLSL